MARTKKIPEVSLYGEAPETLDEHIFFGLKLDDDQKNFRDAIWSKDYDLVVCEAKAGSGKDLIAIATSILLCSYGRYSNIIYLTAAGVFENLQGAIPGDLQTKSLPLFGPLYQTVARLGYDPMRVIASQDNMIAIKEGEAIIQSITNSYIRGLSFGEHNSPCIVIIDEAQNFTLSALRTAVSRVNDGSKLIVIGENKQCDLKYPQDSGFPRLISVVQNTQWAKLCTLTHNYRGRVSALGDEL